MSIRRIKHYGNKKCKDLGKANINLNNNNLNILKTKNSKYINLFKSLDKCNCKSIV